MSHTITMDSGNPFVLHLSDWRSDRAPPNINFCELPSRILVPTMHTYCHIPAVHEQCWVVFTNHSSAMDKSWIVSWWFSKTSSTTCTVFTCYLSASLKGVIFMMDANPLLNSLHPLPKWCGLSTPTPNTSINWQWISRVEMFCLYKLSHHKIFCMTEFPLSLPLQINLSPNWHD